MHELMENHFSAREPTAANALRATAVWNAPFQARFDGSRVFIKIGPIKTEARLQAQTVSSAETDRLDAWMIQDPARQSFDVVVTNANLEAVLASISRTRHRAGQIGQRDRRNVHELHSRYVGV